MRRKAKDAAINATTKNPSKKPCQIGVCVHLFLFGSFKEVQKAMSVTTIYKIVRVLSRINV